MGGDGQGAGWSKERTCARVLLCLTLVAAGAAPGQTPRGAERSVGPPAAQAPHFESRPGVQGGGASQHLPQWMANHQNLNSAQKEQALRNEPGFSRLPAEQQQHLIDRLHQLDNAPPQVRQRIMARNEMFERLPPERQQSIRNAAEGLRQLPPERGIAVRKAFRDLRVLPPDQRALVLNSARFQAEFTPEERGMMTSLLSIEPVAP